MSLRNINHQAAIELGECDTEFVATLKKERRDLYQEGAEITNRNELTRGASQRLTRIMERLYRIEELLAK